MKILKFIVFAYVGLIGVLLLLIAGGALFKLVIPPDSGSIIIHYLQLIVGGVLGGIGAISAFRYLRRYPFSYHNYILSFVTALMHSLIFTFFFVIMGSLLNTSFVFDNDEESKIFTKNFEYIMETEYPNDLSYSDIIENIERYYPDTEIYKMFYFRQSYKALSILLFSVLTILLSLLNLWPIKNEYGIKYVKLALGILFLLSLFIMLYLLNDEAITIALHIENHGLDQSNLSLSTKMANLKQIWPLFSNGFNIFKMGIWGSLVFMLSFIVVQWALLSRSFNEL